jgi:hypothetical protein
MQWPEVHLEIDERDIARIEVGQEAFLTADAYPDRTLDAVVDRIAPEAITERGIMDVILRPVEPPDWLRPGMTMDASIVVEEKSEVLVLPVGAVVQSEDESSVLVVDDGVIRRLRVATGLGGVRGTIIRNGLREEALVVREPSLVRVGQRVRPVETRATPEGEADV